MRKPYPSDMTDDQWAILEPLIPVVNVGENGQRPAGEEYHARFTT